MTDFDPEKFEEKYVHYFDELQEAYRNAFQYMHDRHDSSILRPIDHRILSESEPFYGGNGEFRIELPDDPYERVSVPVSEETFDEILSTFVERIEVELRRVFELDDEG